MPSVITRRRSGREEAVDVALGRCFELETVCGEPVQQSDGTEDLDPGVTDRGASGRVAPSLAPQATQHVPSRERGDDLAVLRPLDLGDGPVVAGFEADKLLVSRLKGAARDEHAAQVVRRARLRVCIEGLMGHRHGPGRHRREDRRTGSLAQPVQRFAWRRRGDDRVVKRDEGGRNASACTTHELPGAAREHTTITERTLVALVLATTQPTDVRRQRSKAGTVTAHRRSRPGGRDEAPLLPAVVADSPPTQRGGVTGVAHRALGPTHGGRSIRAAVRTNRLSPREAPLASRGAEGDELAWSVTPAGRARGKRQLVAVDTDVR